MTKKNLQTQQSLYVLALTALRRPHQQTLHIVNGYLISHVTHIMLAVDNICLVIKSNVPNSVLEIYTNMTIWDGCGCRTVKNMA